MFKKPARNVSHSNAGGDISDGVVHKTPIDLRELLTSNSKALTVWEDLTPLARNEWICWVTFVKKDKTRKEHIKRTIIKLNEGVRRPCCWIGCIHRKDKLISPSVQAMLSKQTLYKQFRTSKMTTVAPNLKLLLSKSLAYIGSAS